MNIHNSLIWLINSFLINHNNTVESSDSNPVNNAETHGLKISTLNHDNTISVNDGSKFKHKKRGLINNINEYNFGSSSNCVEVKHQDDDDVCSVWSYDPRADTDIESETEDETSPPDSSQVVSTHFGDDFSQHTGSDSVVSQDESGNDSKQTGDSYSTENKYRDMIDNNTKPKMIWILFENNFEGYKNINGEWVLKFNRNLPYEQSRKLFNTSASSPDLHSHKKTSIKPEFFDLKSKTYLKDKSLESVATSLHSTDPQIHHTSTEGEAYSSKVTETRDSTEVKKEETTSSKGTESEVSFQELVLKNYYEDQRDTSKTQELDHYQFKTKRGDSDKHIIKYEFETDEKCKEIKYRDDIVWKHGDNNCSEYPKSIYSHPLATLYFIEFENSIQFYRKNIKTGTWTLETLNKKNHLDKDKIKLYTKEGSELQELEPDKYKIKEFDFAYEFSFEEDANCTELKYDDKTIYKCDEKNKKEQNPLVLYLITDESYVVIYKNLSFYDKPYYLSNNLSQKMNFWEKLDLIFCNQSELDDF